MSWLQYARTLRYLRPVQLYGFARNCLLCCLPAGPATVQGACLSECVQPPRVPFLSALTNVQGTTLTFLNHTVDYPQGLGDQFARIAKWASFSEPGHWPDADMLPLGYLGPAPGWGKARQTRLSLLSAVAGSDFPESGTAARAYSQKLPKTSLRLRRIGNLLRASIGLIRVAKIVAAWRWHRDDTWPQRSLAVQSTLIQRLIRLINGRNF